MVAFENKAQFLFQKVTKTLEQEFETNRLNIKNLGGKMTIKFYGQKLI